MKYIQQHQLLGKCKSKLQWDTTSLPLRWLWLKKKAIRQEYEATAVHNPYRLLLDT